MLNCYDNTTLNGPLLYAILLFFWNECINSKEMSGLSLSVNQSACSLTVSKSFGSEVLCITCFAVDFSVVLRLSGRLQTLSTFGTAKAVLMPRLPSAHHFLSGVHGLSTARTLLRAAELLRKLGRVWVGGGSVSLGSGRTQRGQMLFSGAQPNEEPWMSRFVSGEYEESTGALLT